jgi:uncharacterized SAM-binding protein YcdF (DUF218 family)
MAMDRSASRLSRILRYLVALLRGVTIGIGLFAALLIVLAFTPIPYHLHHWLGTAGGGAVGRPTTIVVLGGSGMPSGPELLRLHKAAEVALRFPEAQVVVVHPIDTVVLDLMVEELVLRGVGRKRITMEAEGTSTREQALRLLEHRPGLAQERFTVVTAPENMYRSLAVLRKLGCGQVQGAPAFDTPMFVDLRYAHRGVGGKTYVPDVSGRSSLRYDFWNYLKLEVTCLREYMALAYYKLNGWI